jgi:thiol-disulfide isomerase/thioredoxin
MKRFLAILSIITACLNQRNAVAQQVAGEENDLQGAMELTIDVSSMKDTVGNFMLMVGGELFYPQIKNNVLTLNKLMKEPRRAFLSFYPAQKVKENPGKPLNYIASEFSDSFEFLAVPGKYRLAVDGTVANSKIMNASPYQEKFAALLKLKADFGPKMEQEQAELVKQMISAQDKPTKDSLTSIYIKYAQEQYPRYYQQTVIEFLKNNPDEPTTLFELEESEGSGVIDLKTLNFLYNNLTKRLKTLPTGRRVYAFMDQKNFENSNLLGKLALDFTQNTPSGEAVSLRDFKGHVTLLEFWASWCGPCRESNPGLVKTYNKYSGRGFRILGVSLDDDKEKWLKAIKDDGLMWTHVSDLKQFDNAAADLYHISGIPSNFLIDETGKVIAANLHGKELEEYLGKLLR